MGRPASRGLFLARSCPAHPAVASTRSKRVEHYRSTWSTIPRQHDRHRDAVDAGGEPAPIPGEPIDPPQKAIAETLQKVDDKGAVAAVAFRTFLRFSHAKVTLLAAGTTYHLFLSVFAILVFAFGLAALIGARNLPTR